MPLFLEFKCFSNVWSDVTLVPYSCSFDVNDRRVQNSSKDVHVAIDFYPGKQKITNINSCLIDLFHHQIDVIISLCFIFNNRHVFS